MSRAISRDSFNELKQYIGVHLQQGRVILDSDWNEGQDIMANLARRLGQDAFGDGVLDEGFEIQPVIPSMWNPASQELFELSYFQGHLPVSMRFPPNEPFDSFESMDGWALAGSGKLRISRDRPYEGRGFLRLSDHTGEVTVAKTLSSPTDLSAFQYGHFRFRLNHDASVPGGAAKFFIEDTNGNRNLWPLTAPWAAKDRWFLGAALPLDLRFHLFDMELLPATIHQSYHSALIAFPVGGKEVVFSITGHQPPGLNAFRIGSTPNYGLIIGTPREAGTFNFTVNATNGETTAARDFTLRVTDLQRIEQRLDLSDSPDRAVEFWKMIHARPTTRGGAANLSSIKKYGFIISSAGAAPAVWDFDALHFSSRALVDTKARNNFIISGSSAHQATHDILTTIQARDLDEKANDLLSAVSQSRGRTTRAFVSGYACNQPHEMLYSDQRDPADPAISPPPDQSSTSDVRYDLVYLDVTREPVTYINDPDLREIALGGPDTSTRMQVRQRVRVAPGGVLPTDSGIGGGTLATEGIYTDRSNRLYLVEVDTPGDIGTATVRWSDDNGSTLQRVIETIPSESQKIRVEDASAFHAGDFILLRNELLEEEHRVASVIGNTITIQATHGVSKTFSFAERPYIQRWNAFRAPVVTDLLDSTISEQIDLSFGVAVRFGGRALKRGDFWTFRTRHLAGDTASGIGPSARIEALDFQPPQGVLHHYTPLALLVRDPVFQLPDRVQLVHDLRRRAGRIVPRRQQTSITFNNPFGYYDKFLPLGEVAQNSAFLCLWSGKVHYKNPSTAGASMVIEVDFYDRELTVPFSTIGKIGTATPMIFNYDNQEITRSVMQFIPRPPGPGAIAARAKYTAQFSHDAVGDTIVDGTLVLIEFKNMPQDLPAFPFGP